MRLTPEEFAKSVMRTANTAGSVDSIYSNILFGLFGETGEFVDLVKKRLFHQHYLDHDKIVKEAGDILFYSFWLMQLNSAVLKEVGLRHDMVIDIYHSSFTWWTDFTDFRCNDALNARFCNSWPSPNKPVDTTIALATTHAQHMLRFISFCFDRKALYNLHHANSRVEKFLDELKSLLALMGTCSDFGEIAYINKEKLESRYPVRFTPSQSINRGE